MSLVDHINQLEHEAIVSGHEIMKQIMVDKPDLRQMIVGTLVIEKGGNMGLALLGHDFKNGAIMFDLRIQGKQNIIDTLSKKTA
jgi:hypothetical protein